MIIGNTYHHHNGTTSPVDHFLTNNPDLYDLAGICPFAQSDHDIIFATRKKHKVKPEKIKLLACKYKNMDNGAFKNDVTNHNWDEVLQATDVDQAWEAFVSDLNHILDNHAPWKWMHFDDNMPI